MAFKLPIGKKIDPTHIADDLIDDLIFEADPLSKNSPQNAYLLAVEKLFVPKCIEIGIKQSLAEQQLNHFLVPSLEEIKDKWQTAYENGNITESHRNRAILRSSNKSAIESCRQVFIQNQLAKSNGQKLARMLSTPSKVPDFEHALLEGRTLPLERVLKALTRFGCHHSYELLN